MRAGSAVLVAVALLLTQSSALKPPPLPQDAYVWQRHWTPALRTALRDDADLMAGWRVLAAETDRHGTLEPVAVDWAALRATHRPLTAVIRIDGTREEFRVDEELAAIGALLARWRGAPLAGLEIDFDCATQRLPTYARFLRALRHLPGLPPRLSVTALPSWMPSAALDDVLAAVDEAVLQVHAVDAPEAGLFDPDRAQAWIDAFAARTAKPFRVALPDYGARILRGADGRIVAIESEMPRLMGDAASAEIMAPPAAVARLLDVLRFHPPKDLAGVVWFRLPTTEDDLSWSPSTWRAVVTGGDLATRLDVEARPRAIAGLCDIVLVDRGDIDAVLPRRLRLPRGCRIADGVNGYAAADDGGEYFLIRLQTALLRAHHARVVGWMRCSGGTIDVRP